MILFFNLELLQDKIVILIATKELVLELSHDLYHSLILGIAPWDWSRLRNIIRDTLNLSS